MNDSTALAHEATPVAEGSRFAADVIVLRRVAGPRAPIQASATIAHAVRGALMSHAEDPIPALICGHHLDGRPLDRDHLAIAALPDVGRADASGELLGAAIIPPAGLDLGSLRPIHAAIARWEARSASAAGSRCVLTLGRLGRWELAREPERGRLTKQLAQTWTRSSRSWASVTPVVLDRHPGSFARQRSRAVARAEQSICAACRRIGLPEPVGIEIGHSGFGLGSIDAREFWLRPGRSEKRPRVHVWLRFGASVRGPVLIGAGRYYGLGLLQPWGL